MFLSQIFFFLLMVFVATAFMYRFKRAGFSIFEPGVTFGAFVFLYSIIPLLAFSLINDIFAHPQADVRLTPDTASPESVSSIGSLHLWFFACFTLTYLLLRIKGKPLRINGFRATDLELIIGATLLIGCKAIVWLALRYFDVSAGSYLETYTQLDSLPLFARQLLTHLSGLTITCSVLLCTGLMSRREYRWILPIWLAIELTLLLGSLGSRTTVFTICLAALASYHYFVRRISIPLIVTTLSIVVFAFLLIGAYRDMGSHVSSAPEFLIGMFIRNEFTSVFVNALDIQRLRDAGITDAIVPQFYFSDFLNTIPQQFLPIEKLDVSSWYVEHFYPEYAALGGAFAFGIIAESVVGLGYLEAGVRAVVLSTLLARVHIWITRSRHTSLWMLTFYVWLLVLSFRLFRGTTFALVPVFILDYFTAYIMFRIAHVVALAYLQATQCREKATFVSS